MVDYFALLDEPRRPWLDPEVLQAKFQALAAPIHPDRVHHSSEHEKLAANQCCAELNAAYQCLRDLKYRLHHLLELERGSKLEVLQNISPDTMDLSMQISQICRETDGFIAEKAKVTAPLLKVQLFERGMMLTDRLNLMLGQLDVRREALIVQLRNLNMAWETAPPVGSFNRLHVLPCSRLEHIYRDISYLKRWTQQLQGRRVELSL